MHGSFIAIFETFEPAHDFTYNKTSVINQDSDQSFHLPSMARVHVYPSLDRLETVEDTCEQQRL